VKTYVINLARSPQRLAHMKQALGRIGVAFERFEAIDVERARRHPVYSRIPPHPRRDWTPGELACLLSHFEVWKLIAAGMDRFGAVFEDDIHVDPRLREVLADQSFLPDDAEVIKLETVDMPVWVSRQSHAGPAGVRFSRLLSTHHGAGAYLLSKDAAHRLVASIDTIGLPPDDMLFGMDAPSGCRLRSYQAIPALAVQDVILSKNLRSPALHSTLEDERAQAVPENPRWRQTRSYRLARAPIRLLRRLWYGFSSRQLNVPFVCPAGATGDSVDRP
jgi:glycosyl transferase family 25